MEKNKINLIWILVFLLVVAGAMYILKGKNTSGSSDAQLELTTTPNPLQMGAGTFNITVRNDNGALVDDAKIDFDLNMTAMNMGTQRGTATSQGNGVYAATGRLTMRGPWKVTTKVTFADGKQTQKDFMVNVP